MQRMGSRPSSSGSSGSEKRNVMMADDLEDMLASLDIAPQPKGEIFCIVKNLCTFYSPLGFFLHSIDTSLMPMRFYGLCRHRKPCRHS